MAKHIHVHVHDSMWTYNGTYDPKDDEKWKRIWSKLRPVSVIRDAAPVELDPDLLELAFNKPQHIVQELYQIQEQRNQSGRPSLRPLWEDTCSCGKK